MLMQKERELIVEYGRKMSSSGLSVGTSGNLSICDRATGYMAISPSGIDYFETRPEDVVIMDLDSHIIDGVRKPSSEWALHSEFYRRKPDIGAVVHTHSLYCTAFAVLGRGLRAVHYAMAGAGVAEIPCIPYYLFGSEELAKAAAEGCGEGMAVLLGNHGLVACGADIASAFSLAENCEYVAKLQQLSESIGNPNLLTDEEMARAIERFKSYGQGTNLKQEA